MRYKTAAFSLIEALWGVLILSILIITVTGIFTGILTSTKKSEKLVVATNLAQKQLEYIKLMDFSDIPCPRDFDGRNSGITGIEFKSSYFPPYPEGQPAPLKEVVDGITYYYRVQTRDVTGTGKLIGVVVSVYWDKNIADTSGKNFVMLELYKAQ